jgi:hypothetical protein
MGYPVVAIPGVGKWRPEWAVRFEEFESVRICFDCDEQGRDAAVARAKDLHDVTDVHRIELDPDRDDGFDVGDLLIKAGEKAAGVLQARAVQPAGGVSRLDTRRRDEPRRPPFEAVYGALEARECRIRDHGDRRLESQCPNHDDRRPSLSVTEGDDGRVLLHCHAGCDPADVVRALGLELKDLFAA